MEHTEKLVVNPIGIVRNGEAESRNAGFDWSAVISKIELKEAYGGYTQGLEDYSHAWIVFWIHLAQKKKLVAEIHPRGDKSLPLVGVFASRSPNRPNPVGLKLVEVLEVSKQFITVRGLDALDGTPVVDIKPYSPGYDSVLNFRVPPWSSSSQHG